MKYLIRVEHYCEEVRNIARGSWFIIESDKKPKLGVINERSNARTGPLPSHGCKNYYYRQSCDEDPSCNWQQITEIRNYSKEEAKKLNAVEISRQHLR